MRLGTIAFLVGILLFHALPEPPDRWWSLMILAVALFALHITRLRLLVWGSTGFLWALLWVVPSSQLQLPSVSESADLWVEGWVASLPETLQRSTRFELQVDSIRSADNHVLPFTGRIRLSWYTNTPSTLRVGDKWGFAVRLKRPRGLANPGGFDYERWLFVNGIAGKGYVKKVPAPRLLGHTHRYPVNRFRQTLAQDFGRLLPEHPYLGILTALAVGDRHRIGKEQWEIFQRTGTAHLMAISGLHIGLIAGFSLIVFRHGWACFPVLVRSLPPIKAGALAALLAALGYALLAGLSLPTQRALIMVMVVVLALLWQRPLIPSRALAVACLLVLILDPLAPLTGGFWLSFGAVAVILYRISARPIEISPTRHWLGLQVVITLALLPATVILFQSVPLLSPAANLVAIPWASVTVVPLSLLAVPAGLFSETLRAGLLQLAALAMDGLWQFLVWLNHAPWSVLFRPAPPLWTLLFALPGLALLLAPRGLPMRWIGGILCLPLLFVPMPAPGPKDVWFTLLDVGHGRAAVVRTTNHVLVYDTGPRMGPRLDAGSAVLVPFLRQQGLTYIDTLIISHGDSLHTGGVRSLRERISVMRTLTTSPRDVPIEGAVACRAGMTWVWDEVRFNILHPRASGFTGKDSSCVLLVEGAGGRVLLPGDIGVPGELALVKAFGSNLASDVLVVPGHGAGVSSPAFITAVQPRYALFSTGYKNRFGFPKPETVDRYREAGAMILDTARDGAITFRFEDGKPEPVPERYRQEARRYWHTP